MTPLQRTQAKRNQLLRALCPSVFSRTYLADVFDLSRSRVAAIVANSDRARSGIASRAASPFPATQADPQDGPQQDWCRGDAAPSATRSGDQIP